MSESSATAYGDFDCEFAFDSHEWSCSNVGERLVIRVFKHCFSHGPQFHHISRPAAVSPWKTCGRLSSRAMPSLWKTWGGLLPACAVIIAQAPLAYRLKHLLGGDEEIARLQATKAAARARLDAATTEEDRVCRGFPHGFHPPPPPPPLVPSLP